MSFEITRSRCRITLARSLAAVILAALPMSGCLYTKIRTPLDTDVASTTLGSKVGTSENQSVLWLVAWGDGGTAAAAKNGGIQTINHMDTEIYFVLFGLYSRTTTIVYGD